MSTLIKANQLKALILIASKAGVRFYLNGVFFDPAGYAVATDGHMLLAVRVPAWDGAGFIVPREACVTVLRGLTPSFIAMGVAISVTGTELSGKPFTTIDAKYPVWRRVIPATPSGEHAEYNPDLLAALQSAVSTASDLSKYTLTLCRNGERAAVARTPEDILALVMPLRQDVFTPADAAGSVAQFLKTRS